MRHVHLLDPQLTGLGGHYFNHDFQLLSEVKRRGLGASLYGRVGCSVGQCGDIPVIPVFSNDIFVEVGRDPVVWAIENFHALSQAFVGDLSKIDTRAFSADDLLYFPNILQNQVYAVALWLNGIPASRRPAVALMFRYLNHAMDYVQARQNKEMIAHFYRYAVRQLYGMHKRTLICADTTELAAAYKEITGIPVIELPNPMDVSDLMAKSAPPAPKDRPVVVYQGHTSALRGFEFLPEIIQRSLKLPQHPRFIVQVQSNDENTRRGPMGRIIAALEGLSRDDVRLVPGALSQDDYFAMLAEADVVLLPYKPSFYGKGSSGVFSEAASIGKVVVVSADTVPARQGREYGLGVVIAEQWSAESMAKALAEALRDLPRLSACSMAAAPKYRNDNSASAFWTKLLGAVDRVLPKPPIS